MKRPGRIVIASLAVTLCTAAFGDRVEPISAARRDGTDFQQRLRSAQGQRICAIDRLAESRLPRTTCLTAREWRDRQLRWLRKE